MPWWLKDAQAQVDLGPVQATQAYISMASQVLAALLCSCQNTISRQRPLGDTKAVRLVPTISTCTGRLAFKGLGSLRLRSLGWCSSTSGGLHRSQEQPAVSRAIQT